MDRIIRATAENDLIKMSVLTAKDMVAKAKEIHNCTPTSITALGRAICGASIMGNMMKEENASTTIRINGGGPIGTVIAVSDSIGNVRGMVGDPSVDLPMRENGSFDISGAVGLDGSFTVIRDIGLSTPYVGSTALYTGEIAEDMAAYFVESEQVPSACGLSVMLDHDLGVKAAGGFLVQLMPGASDDLLTKLEDNIIYMDQLAVILDEDGAEEVLAQVLKGFDYKIVEETPVEYRCNCSRERVEDALASLDASELQDMINEGKDQEVCCQFCDKKYIFTPSDLQELLSRR